MADGFAIEVVTPDRLLVDATAQALVLRTSDGEMTVLDGHTSIVAAVVPGIVRVEPLEGEPVRLAVHGGFLQVDTAPGKGGEGPAGFATRVTLLAGIAELAGEIDVERARRARQAAGERVAARSDRPEGDEQPSVEEEAAAGELARAELRLEASGATPS
jgi:F-type H+-transporting ATPase subunit epsilon